MIFDSHTHAWRSWPYDTETPASLGTAETLLRTMDCHGVDRAVVICARIGGGKGADGHANDDNNDYVTAFAAQHPDRIVPWLDVDSWWLPEYHQPGAADRLRSLADRYDTTGFTHYLDYGTNDGWLQSSAGREFFAAAAELHQIASVVTIGTTWLSDIVAIAAENPSLPVLLHHFGIPRRASRYRAEEYDADIAALVAAAPQTNIGIKVSGWLYVSDPDAEYPFEAALELLRTLLAVYGPQRLYWGSDAPVTTQDLTYGQTLDLIRAEAGFLSPADADRVLGGNLAKLLSRT
jgi:L-fuconolactonase